ncbi:MAG: DUF5107 domain-containing protein, partial [Bacteroidales bacterium]|nr:DUF5107 domain-containing protein [Bacteroidales bacterium]
DGNPSSFPETLKCELPHETLLEMALWYLDCGLEEEAATLCGLTDYPTATYLRAYMLREKDPSRSLELLEKADAASPGFVFPFRPEMLEVFDWAFGTGGCWKADYYRALILWRHARKDEARDLMERCGDKPDYAPFYLTRARLRKGEGRLQDLRKAESLSGDWRTGKALVDFHSAAGDWDEACRDGKKYFRKYPDKFELGLAYADALCGAGEYAKSLKVLSGLEVMPKEGARRGHQIYRKACLGKARKELEEGKFNACIKSVEASKLWDERLGVGKPYDELIDYSEEEAIMKAARERNRTAFK